MKYIAEPLNRKQLRQLAYDIRKILGYEDVLRFPIIWFLENVMPVMFGATYHIADYAEMEATKHGETDVVNRCISIREDVYYGAVEGSGRDRMTVAHESGHYILFVACGVKFARTFDKSKEVPTFQDPEWQAKAFAGELLCPAHLIKNMSAEQIVDKCGVSLDAAVYQLRQSRR